jgi:methylenetetrahydrofolate dehydrogenase (NADP+) / methenyltetrahydrofolate cyclohydrolase
MTKILEGAPVKEKIKKELIEKIKKLGKGPVLAIVQVGDRADSNTYVKQKQKFGEEIGVKVVIKKFSEEISEQELIQEVKNLNDDKNVDGIIVQLPLSENFDKEKILNLISKEKDADGLVGSFSSKKIIPATARGVMALLDFYKIEIVGKKAAVIGRSKLAGAPIAEELKLRGAQVTVCHRGTENMAEICKNSDILVVAAGKAGLVTKDFVHKDQIIIDVGINKNIEGKLVGDVNFAEVEPLVSAITPVPGGVGPLTVACLFQNLVDLMEL